MHQVNDITGRGRYLIEVPGHHQMLLCDECFGEGQAFLGAWMSSNPSSSSDYEEIYEKCKTCNGTGYVLQDAPPAPAVITSGNRSDDDG